MKTRKLVHACLLAALLASCLPKQAPTAVPEAPTAPAQTSGSQVERSPVPSQAADATPASPAPQTDLSQPVEASPDQMPQVIPREVTNAQAVVTAVDISGEAGNYTFNVTIESPDTGCDTYANWWEVITPEGELLYRRILAHSHVDEQPFTRSGGPVAISPTQPVIVRSHMYPYGYSPEVMEGVVEMGFIPTTLPEGFAAELATVEPQPSGCTF